MTWVIVFYMLMPDGSWQRSVTTVPPAATFLDCTIVMRGIRIEVPKPGYVTCEQSHKNGGTK